jgi:hypothetical protein
MRHYWLTSDAPDLPANAFHRAFGRNRPATLEGGGKGGGSAPSYPDPNVVAQATTNTNEATAAYNKALNLNNYSNPFGSQQTVQTGTDPNTGAPIYSTQTSINPALAQGLGQAFGGIFNSANINQNSLNGLYGLNSTVGGLGSQAQGIGGQYAGYAQGALGLTPQYQSINTQLSGLGGQLNNGAAANAQQQGQNAAYASQTQYLDPQFAQQKESLDAQLANQGITPGSQAYNNAMLNFNNTKQQAYSNAQNQAVLTGSQIGTQNLNNQIAGINTQAGLLGQQSGNIQSQAGLYGLAGQLGYGQLGALGTGLNATGQQAGLYGQQVGVGQLPYSNMQTLAGLIPGYSGTSQSAASPADIAGLYNNQYQSQLAGYNGRQASSNNMMSGLFGLGSAAMLAFA